MNKRFLWICIVLMALVLVVGCEDSPNDDSSGQEDREDRILQRSMLR